MILDTRLLILDAGCWMLDAENGKARVAASVSAADESKLRKAANELAKKLMEVDW